MLEVSKMIGIINKPSLEWMALTKMGSAKDISSDAKLAKC
jgi:hypothetical protein